MNDHSFELGTNVLGRAYAKHNYSTGDTYAYNKLSINFPEIGALVVAFRFVPGIAATVGATGAGIQIFK